MRKVLGLILVLAFGPSVSNATTLAASDVLARARVYLRDQSTSANRQTFPDSTLLQFLSDGMREANAQNWVYQSSYTLTLIQGTTEYALPNDFMAIERIWYQQPGQNYIKLLASSFDQLDAQSAGWTSATGFPIKYFIDTSAPPNVYLGMYPAPSIVGSTGTLIIYYVQQSYDVLSTTQTLFNNNLVYQPYASALAYYVAGRGFMTVEETDLADEYFKLWYNFLSLMHQGMGKTPDFNPGFIGQHGASSVTP